MRASLIELARADPGIACDTNFDVACQLCLGRGKAVAAPKGHVGSLRLVGLAHGGDALGVGGERLDAGALDLQ
jgi:hypothetical protein